MIAYIDLSLPLRSSILLGFFLAMCVGGWLICNTYPRQRGICKALLPAEFLLCAALVIVYTAAARADLRDLAVPDISLWLCRQPVLLPLVVLILVWTHFALVARDEIRFRKNTITRSSIKEGVDKISSGLCFYLEGGRVVLVNSRMIDLCHRIVGRDLQNAELFWQILSGGEVRPDVVRLSYGEHPKFRLPDGTVWSFARTELEGFIQLTAAQTTQQQHLTDELRENNLELAALNLRLRRYGENVDALTRATERLETKVRIHGEVGQALMAARRYLVGGASLELPLEIWRRNIAMLRKEAEMKKGDDPLQILEKAARSAGVQLQIHGRLPEDPDSRQFFLMAASEALTNAVFHAAAGTLCIELAETDLQWSIRFTNDGRVPDGPIVEGGGLGSLRRKAENIGAVMTVEHSPVFALVLTGRKGEYGCIRS